MALPKLTRISLAGALLAVASLGLTACAVGPDYERPETPKAGTDAYKNDPKAVAQPALGSNWWTLFDDPELTKLEEASVRANQDLRAAMARVGQARALSAAADSGFWPSITANPSIQRGRTSGTMGSSGFTSPGRTATTTTLPVDFSYEVDIWGRIRRLSEAADEADRRFP